MSENDYRFRKNQPETLFVATADATHANSTTETTIVGVGNGKMSIPANTLAVGDRFRLRARGYIGTHSTAGTLAINATVGGSSVATTGGATATNSLSNVAWECEVEFTVRSIGATGTVVAGGFYRVDDGSAIVEGMPKTTATTVDTTGALAVDLTADWGTANAANTITCQQVIFEKLN